MHYQTGIAREMTALLPPSVEDYVPADHPVRVIDAFVSHLDLSELGFRHAVLAHTGRPPYHPKDLLGLYLWGFLNRVRSTRGLEREAGRNLEVMWLLRLLRPDFKTLANFRRDNAPAIGGVCKAFVRFCRGQGLLGATLVAIDGTKIEAVASRKAVWTQKRLEKAQERLEESTRQYLEALAESERTDVPDEEEAQRVRAALEVLSQRKQKLEDIQQALAQEGGKQHVRTEPEAKQMKTRGKGSPVAYNVQVAVDSEHALIIAHTLTNAGNDHQQLLPSAELAKEALEVSELTVVADAGYHNGEHAQACEAQGIVPVVPMQASSHTRHPGGFPKSAFRYDPEHDTYECPAHQTLEQVKEEKSGRRHYATNACADCPLRAQCTSTERRTVIREPCAEATERATARATPEMMRIRRSVAEHPIGGVKWLMGLPRFLCRGFNGAGAEMSLAVTAYNLKRVISILGVPALLQQLRPA